MEAAAPRGRGADGSGDDPAHDGPCRVSLGGGDGACIVGMELFFSRVCCRLNIFDNQPFPLKRNRVYMHAVNQRSIPPTQQ